MLCYILFGVASVHYDVILGFYKYILTVTVNSCDLHMCSHLSSSLFQWKAKMLCVDQVHVITWQQLLAIRLASQQVLQVALVNSAIGLCVAAQFGSRVTCSCHVTVALKDLLAIPYHWPNLRVRTLVLHGGKKTEISLYFNSTRKCFFFSPNMFCVGVHWPAVQMWPVSQRSGVSHLYEPVGCFGFGLGPRRRHDYEARVLSDHVAVSAP